jgi:hypothetical protein
MGVSSRPGPRSASDAWRSRATATGVVAGKAVRILAYHGDDMVDLS